MIVSVINLSNGRVTDEKLQDAIRAVNRQISEDFEPHWRFGGMLRLEGRASRAKGMLGQSDMRGDAVLYIWDHVDPDGVDGYHDKNFDGIPYGAVFLGLSEKLDEPWTVTLSHEALELIGDPQSNLLVQGPHPQNAKHQVYHWFEMCDAVQSEKYRIDGVWVSNFILPLYFTSSDERGGRNDFLGTTKGRGKGAPKKTLQSFGVNPGGYVGYFDPESGTNETYFAKNDAVAARRVRLKRRLRTGRGTMRRERTTDVTPAVARYRARTS